MHPVCYRIFISIPGSSTTRGQECLSSSSLQVVANKQKVSRYCQMSPGGRNHTWLRTTIIEYPCIHSFTHEISHSRIQQAFTDHLPQAGHFGRH